MKRFVITMGDARVGKSTVARLLLELYVCHQKNLRVFYHGERNKLSMYTQSFEISHLGFARGESDRLLLDLENFDNDLVLTDMPGQSLTAFKFFEQDVSLIENLKFLGYRVTFLNPVSHRKDCVEYLQELCQYFENKVDYLIIKNLYFGENFRYDTSSTKGTLQKFNALELKLSALQIYELVEDTNLPYHNAMQTNSPLNIAQRSLLWHWMTSFHSGITSNGIASIYLGLNNQEDENW